MTGKRIDKDFLSLIYISILTILALLYGLTAVPDPAQQRKIRLDEERENHLRQLRTNITEYYSQKYVLPTSLRDLSSTSYYASETLQDPQTQQPYEYSLISPTTYSLCATFETDFAEQKKTRDLYQDPEFSHPMGHHCFIFTVTPQSSSGGAVIAPIWNPKDNTYIPLGSSQSAEGTKN